MARRLVRIAIALSAALLPALPAAAACKLDLVAQMPVTMHGLSPVTDAKIDGQDAHLVVDLGAFFGSISRSRVDRYHLKVGGLPPYLTVQGVNGEADVGLATVDFNLLGAHFAHTQFLVGGPEAGPTIDGILGRNFLMVADTELDFANGMVRMFHPEACQAQVLAYWDTTGAPYSIVQLEEPRGRTGAVIGQAKVNGVNMRVLFDSGATTSVLTLRAAGRAGIHKDDPGVTPSGLAGGFGRHSIETWVAPVTDFKIGDEEIKNTRLRIGGIDLDDADMLIGADFMLSHRIYIARSQGKLYFTYNGGPVFRLDGAPPRPMDTASAAPAVAPTATGAAPPAEEPKDASGFARRAAASAARREYPQAIDDLGRAIDLDPKDPQLPYDRAMARLGNRQPLLAVADLDQALKLKPDFTLALLARGRLKLANRDPDGARADFDAAARLDPALRYEIARAYEDVGLMKPAIASYDQWILANPKDERLGFALNGRCWARAIANQELEIALADCDRALKLRPGTAEILDSRGLVHLRLGQYDQAIEDYDAALGIQPKIAWAHYGRGVAELKTGKTAEGEADIKAAGEISPVVAMRGKRLGIGPDNSVPTEGAAPAP